MPVKLWPLALALFQLQIAFAADPAAEAPGAPDVVRDRDEKARPCDWREVSARAKGGQFVIAYQCAQKVDFKIAAVYSVFIDVDRDRATGYRGAMDNFPIGADYLLQGGMLYRYQQNEAQKPGTDWYWDQGTAAQYKLLGNSAEITFPLSKLEGAKNSVDLLFYADNTTEGVKGNFVDVVPDDALRVGGGGKSINVPLK